MSKAVKSIFNTALIASKTISLWGLLPVGKIWYFLYLLRRGLCTGRNMHRFKSFGKDSMLAPGLILLHPENITIGSNSSIMRNCVIETIPVKNVKPVLAIGNEVSIGEYSHITCANKIVIGNGLLTGRFVLITDNSHGRNSLSEMDTRPLEREVYSKGPVIIEKNVWIGDKVTILPGVTVGQGAVIAANSVVSKDVPAFSVVGGIPAKLLKNISNEGH